MVAAVRRVPATGVTWMTASPEVPLATTLVAPPPAVPVVAPAEFAIGAVVRSTFRVWWRHAALFGVMSLVASLPVALWQYRAQLLSRQMAAGSLRTSEVLPASLDLLGWFSVAMVLGVILYSVQLGAITRGTFDALRGRPVRAGEMLEAGLRRALPVMGMYVLMMLGVMGGMILLVVPGLVLAIVWSAAPAAAVVERLGPVQALGRSRALTRGRRWRVLGAMMLLMLAVVGASMAIQLPLTVVAGLVAREPAQVVAILLAGSLLSSALFGAIPVVGWVVVYHDLRRAQEGLDTDALAAVFD
jgi:hypothetical protein